MAIEQLLKYVPAAALAREKPLAEEDNALGPWREAVARLVKPADDDEVWNRLQGEAASASGDEAAGTSCCRTTIPFAFPDGEDGRHVRQLLAANQPALERIELGIQRGRLQLPESQDAEAFERFLEWPPFFRIVPQLFRTRALAAAADGDFEMASRDLLSILHAGELLSNADIFVVGYLIGMPIQRVAMASIGGLASVAGIPDRVRAALAAGLRHSIPRSGDLARCVRFDFRNFDLPCLDCLPDDNDLEKLIHVWVARNTGSSFWEFDLDETTQRVKLEARRARHRQYLRCLLEGHPCPFDKVATVRLVGRKVADAVYLLRRPSQRKSLNLRRLWVRWRWRRLQRWLNRQSQEWPGGHGPMSWLAFDDVPEDIRKTMEAAQEEIGLGDNVIPKPPTEAQLQEARARLRRVDNPLGLLAAASLGFDMVPFYEELQQQVIQEKAELASQLESPLSSQQ